MDIYSFINSKAISKHLRDMNYKFDTIEAAWLIYQCKSISMNEKHEAWKQLIDEMPDCRLAERANCKAKESFHSFLKKYMQIEDWLYQVFQEKKETDVYTLRFYCTGEADWSKPGEEDLFCSYKACLSVIESYKEAGEEKIEVFEIKKKLIGGIKTITVTYKANQTVLAVDSCNYLSNEELDITGTFDALWFDFPVPFTKGDVLISNAAYGPTENFGLDGPFVLDIITPWNIERNQKGKKDRLADTTDMNAWGYFQAEDGRIFREVTWNYMDLDYFSKPIKRPHRFLFGLGRYIKGEIGIDLLLTAYRKILMDEILDDSLLKGWYTKEGLMLAGLEMTVEGK